METLKTQIYKGHNGYAAETMTDADANGLAWQISTHKSRNGVACSAIQGRLSGSMFSCDMFGGKRLELAQSPGRCTEKLISETHAAGLLKFAELQKDVKPAYVVGVGQIIITDHPHGNERRRAVYEIESPGRYKTVLLDGSGFCFDDHVNPITEKFGIGNYYTEGDLFDVNLLDDLVARARASVDAKELAQKNEEEEQARVRAEKLERGRKLISEIPDGVASVIMAYFHEDESDMQSDYHNYKTTDSVVLSWSRHERDLFPEMRKAAGKFEGTKVYSVAPEMPEGENPEYWTPRDEHREKYSLGAGYYLGDSKYSGWNISKQRIDEKSLPALQIAAAEGKFFCTIEDIKESAPVPNMVPAVVASDEVAIVDYSEKAFAVVGQTKPIKDKLSELGGSFNARLKCGPGWIFSKKRLDAVQRYLQNLGAMAA